MIRSILGQSKRTWQSIGSTVHAIARVRQPVGSMVARTREMDASFHGVLAPSRRLWQTALDKRPPLAFTRGPRRWTIVVEEPKGLLIEAQRVLHLTNEGLGRVAGVSVRTVQRWWAKRSSPAEQDYCAVARAVAPHDRELARKLAEAGGTTLDALGLSPRPGPVPAAASVSTAAQPVARSEVSVTLRAHTDALVCAAAAALDLSPRAVRPALAAAFAHAIDLGSDLPALARHLAAEKP